MKIGELIAGRFEIERWVARGGVGDVYRAIDRAAGGFVALKSLLVKSFRASSRFEREANVLAGFVDPLVVRYVAHGALADGDAYLAMEWLDGHTLAEILRTNRLSARQSLGLVRHAASALGRAHAKGLVHRDVTPRNLMVIASGDPPIKVLDFGLVRVLDEAGVLTQTGVTIGTPGYLPPEQLVGEKHLDARVDVFALGSILYECLAGVRPFYDPDPRLTLNRTLFGAPPLIDAWPEAPPEVNALVMRMLAIDPDARPASGAEVASEIERYLRATRGAKTG